MLVDVECRMSNVECRVFAAQLTTTTTKRRSVEAAFNALSITNLIVCMMWAKCSQSASVRGANASVSREREREGGRNGDR